VVNIKTKLENSKVAKRLSEDAQGVYTISATPFDDTGLIDYKSVDSLVDFYINKNIAGLTILGMMGEATKMSVEETEIFMTYMMKRVNGRVPVVVGVSDPGTNNLVLISKSSMDAGAAGVMIAPVSGLRTDDAIYNYFEQIFEALGTGIPVCYQDYPQSTNVYISSNCFNRLVRDFDQLVMFKHEDCPGLGKLSSIRNAPNKDDTLRRISILVGNGGIYLPEELARGADGAMTGFAFPEMLVEVINFHKAGKITEAEDLFDLYTPVVRYEQQIGYGLAARKEILRRRGAIANSATRTPGPKLSAFDHEEISHILTRLENRLREVGR
jgi:4-hydroxy-tetrahydrodipicolinate synthase